MAQFFTDFLEYPLDQHPAGWTERWDLESTWKVRSKPAASDGRCLEEFINGTYDRRQGLSWDQVGSAADAEVFTCARSDNQTNSQFGVVVRGGGTTSQDCTGYRLIFTATSVNLGYYLNGSSVTLASTPFTWNVGDFYCLVLNATGTSIKGKWWPKGEPRPDTWGIEATDSAIPAAGWCGVMGYYHIGTRDHDAVGVGTDGDPAPTSPIVVPSGRIRRASLRMMGLVV